MSASHGVRRDSASNRSRSIGTPSRPAIASRWIAALVEPPIAITVVIAFSNAFSVITSDGFWSSHTISTMRRPQAEAMRMWLASAAGIELAPGSDMPSASTALIMVAAVPMVMQVPGVRAMPSSISSQSLRVMLPTFSSAQYFQVSEPLPRLLPRQLPRSIGPAGTKIAGRFMLAAPISSAGVVLSQPPISTAPSAGYERSSSSTSSASRLRYIMVVGFWNGSLSEIAGSSTGNPPACQMPRFTSSARSLKWVWHGLISDQVLTTAITGLPVQSARS